MATLRENKAKNIKARELKIAGAARMIGAELAEKLSRDKNLDAQKISSLITTAISQLAQLQDKIVTLQEDRVIDAERWNDV